MLIQGTKKLLDELNIKPELQAKKEPLFSWHANVVTVYRRKAVVLINDKNNYVIVLRGLKSKEFKNLDEHILKAMHDTLKGENIKDEVIDEFMNYSKDIVYSKTSSRSIISKLNYACSILPYHEELLEDTSIYKTDMGIKASQYLVGDGKGGYITPSEEMKKDINIFFRDREKK